MSKNEKTRLEFTAQAFELSTSNIGQRIRYYRQLAHLTQKELGQRCNLNESTIRNYELGNRYPDFDTSCTIADELEVSYYALTHTYAPDQMYGALSYLYELEKRYHLSPVEINGRMYLGFDCEKADSSLDSPAAVFESFLSTWGNISQAFKNGSIDEKTYLLWQSKYPTFATSNIDSLFFREYDDVEIDSEISTPKKSERKDKKDKK